MTGGRSLGQIRAGIDALDTEVVGLLAKRQELVRQAAAFKTDEDAVRAPDRVEQVIATVRGKATAAGLENLTLLEEPQAALYAWIDSLGDRFRKELNVGDVVLVFDVGCGWLHSANRNKFVRIAEKLGFEIDQLATCDQLLFAVRSAHVDFHHACRLNDRLLVGVSVERARGASLDLRQPVLRVRYRYKDYGRPTLEDVLHRQWPELLGERR